HTNAAASSSRSARRLITRGTLTATCPPTTRRGTVRAGSERRGNGGQTHANCGRRAEYPSRSGGAPRMTFCPSAMATGIAEWGARDADRAAFVTVDRTLTIGELDEAAGHLAARLLEQFHSDAGEETSWLPVVVDRSLETTVALHGAIRAGLPWAP